MTGERVDPVPLKVNLEFVNGFVVCPADGQKLLIAGVTLVPRAI